MADGNPQLDALLELERRHMSGDKGINDDQWGQIKTRLDAYRAQGLAKPLGGTRALSSKDRTDLEGDIGTYANLKGSLGTFNKDYGGNTITGDAENWAQALNSGFGTPGQRDWWANFRQTDNVIRNTLFGATLTPNEKASYEATTISPNMDPEIIKENLAHRAEIIRGALSRRNAYFKKAGYDTEAIDALTGTYGPDFADGATPIWTPKQVEQVPDDKSKLGTPVIPEVADKINEGRWLNDQQAAAYDAFMAANPKATRAQLESFITGLGVSVPTNLDSIIKFRDEHGTAAPGTSGRLTGPDISDVRGGKVNQVGETADAFVRGAADVPTFGTADELAAAGDTIFGDGTMKENLARQRAIDAYDAEHSPWARGFGQLAGGLLLPIGRGAKTIGELARTGGTVGALYGVGSGTDTRSRITGGITGGVAGAALGAGFGKLSDIWTRGKGPGGVPPADPRATGREVANAAADLGIDVLPADVGGPMTRRMTAGTVQTPFGSGPIINASRRANEQAQGVRDRAANMFTEPAADGEIAGRQAQRGLTNWIKTSETRGNRLYDAVSVPGETNADLPATRKALTEITADLDSNRELSRIWTGHPRLKATLDALTPTDTRQSGQVRLTMETEKVRGAARTLEEAESSLARLKNDPTPDPNRPAKIEAATADVDKAKAAHADARAAQDDAYVQANQPPMGGKLSWQDMKRLRSIVGEIVGSPSLGSEGNENAAMRKLYGALSEDMRATAEKSGPTALREFERANGFWRAREQRIKEVVAPVLGKDGNASGQEAFNQIQSWAKEKGNTARAAQMVRSLPRDEAEVVSATIISRLGKPPAGQQNATGDAFSLPAYLTHWNQMDSRAKAAFFSPAQRESLEKLAKVAEGTKEAQRFANTSNTGGATEVNKTTASLTMASGLLLTGHPILAAIAASPAVAQHVSGKLLASPKFVNWLVRAPSNNGPALRAHIQKLGQLSIKDPVVSADLAQLERSLLSAVNDNNMPLSSAASEGKKKEENR